MREKKQINRGDWLLPGKCAAENNQLQTRPPLIEWQPRHIFYRTPPARDPQGDFAQTEDIAAS